MKTNKGFKFIVIGIGLIILIIDQAVKEFIVLRANVGADIMESLLRIDFVKNTGAAFGIGSNSTLTFVVINLVILGIILKFIKSQSESMEKRTFAFLILIIVGGLSNLIDRVCRGYVVDYIDINQIFKFPVFNLADICIVIGCVFMIIVFIMGARPNKVQEKEKGEIELE